MRILLVAIAAAAIACGSAAARPATTAPGHVYRVEVLITDEGVRIEKDRFARGNLIRYPRGAQISFRVRNAGTRPYALRVWATSTLPIRPGRQDTLFVNWTVRGSFGYMRLLGGRVVGPVRTIQVF